MGEAGQRLHVGIFFAVVAVAVAKIGLVIVAEFVVQPAGGQIFARGVRKKTAVVFEIADDKGVERLERTRGGRVDGEEVLKQSRADIRAHSRRQSRGATGLAMGRL